MSDQTDCLAELHLADDKGDNHCTIRCQLPIVHEPPHRNEFSRMSEGPEFKPTPVVITWHTDDRMIGTERV